MSRLLMGSSGDSMNSGYHHGEGKESVKLYRDLPGKAKPKYWNLARDRNAN